MGLCKKNGVLLGSLGKQSQRGEPAECRGIVTYRYSCHEMLIAVQGSTHLLLHGGTSIVVPEYTVVYIPEWRL